MSTKQPANEKQLVFYGSTPMNYIIFRPVHNRLLQDPRLRIWLTGKFMDSGNPHKLYREFNVRRKDVIRMFRARFRKFDMYLVPRWRVALPKVPLKVHFFHGASFKNYALSGHARRFDRLFMVGEYHRRQMVQRGILEEGDPRMAMVGMPKTDCLVDGSLNREDILARIGVDPTRKTILYAPTWSEYGSLAAMGEDIVRSVGERDVNLLIKLHDKSFDSRWSSVDWRKRLVGYEKENVKLIFDWDVCTYLFVADLLISDASSVSSEFTILDRPIIFVDVPELISRYKKADLDTWGRKTGWTAKSIRELHQCIEAAFEDPMKHSEIRKAAARDLFHKPGTATDRAVSEIYRMLALDPPSKTRV